MSGTRILIVDDDAVTLRLIGGLMERHGYASLTARTGEEALRAVQSDPGIDVVILDVALPDVDGIHVCRTLKTDPATAHVPIILVSAVRTDTSSIREGLEAGADGYLLKPVEDIALRAWVKAALHIRRLHRELAARKAASAPSSVEDLLRGFVKLSHAVNNPLQALYANLDMLSLTLPKDPRTEGLITEVLHHAERVADVVANASLLAKTFVGKQKTPGNPSP